MAMSFQIPDIAKLTLPPDAAMVITLAESIPQEMDSLLQVRNGISILLRDAG